MSKEIYYAEKAYLDKMKSIDNLYTPLVAYSNLISFYSKLSIKTIERIY